MTDHAALYSVSHSFKFYLLALALTGTVVLTGCDLFGADEGEDEAPLEEIAILPDSVSMEVGEQVDFSVVGLTASGDTIRDSDLTIRWWSTDTTVFTVQEDGLATGQGSGTAYCVVEATDEEVGKRAGKKALPSRPHFTGRDSALVHLF